MPVCNSKFRCQGAEWFWGTVFAGENALYEADNTLNYFYVYVPYRFWEFIVAQKAIVSTIKYCEISNITVFLLLTYLIWNRTIYWVIFGICTTVKIDFANDDNREVSRNVSVLPITPSEAPVGPRKFCWIQPPWYLWIANQGSRFCLMGYENM